VITVVIPQFVPEDWAADYGGLYVYRPICGSGSSARCFFEPNVVVTDVPYHLRPSDRVPAENAGTSPTHASAGDSTDDSAGAGAES